MKTAINAQALALTILLLPFWWIQLPQQDPIMSDYNYLYLRDKAQLREKIKR